MFCTTVIPTIGRATLTRAVTSVLAQGYPASELEVIVVNDSGAPLPGAAWQQDRRVRVYNTLRRERCVARNTGAALAHGRYLHFLDDDDWLEPGGLEALQRLAQGQPDAAWLYGATLLVDRDAAPLIELQPIFTGNCFLPVMAGEWLPLSSSLIDSRLFFAVGGFDPALPSAEDIDLARRVTLHGGVAATPVRISAVGMGERNSTTDLDNQSQRARRGREQILAERGAFRRLRESAAALKTSEPASWRGRMVRIYATSAVWNLQQRRPGVMVERGVQMVGATAAGGGAIFRPAFWRAVRSAYQSEAFAQGLAAATLQRLEPVGAAAS